LVDPLTTSSADLIKKQEEEPKRDPIWGFAWLNLTIKIIFHIHTHFLSLNKTSKLYA
jgi:hypothetical protein